MNIGDIFFYSGFGLVAAMAILVILVIVIDFWLDLLREGVKRKLQDSEYLKQSEKLNHITRTYFKSKEK